jgi:protein involved in polysaccharide export with SLBB domain
MKKFLIYFLFLLTIGFHFEGNAQQLPGGIENLSDEQLLQLVSKYQLSGLSEMELEMKAKEFGLSSDQILVLKKRMALLDTGGTGSTQASYNNKTDSYVLRNKIYTKGPSIRSRDSSGALQVFGSEIFDNADLSFEPNLSIATPQNYILGVNDQLVIDVYGVSDNTKKLKVTTEGDIRFPNLGPIKVAGLTVEEARIKIRKALTRIYPGIANGTVSVQVSVGQIRSIHVTLLGEVRRPGTYTVSALSTLMNALYASSGPNDIGSFRNIELVRGGKTIVNFDLYDFLIRGDLRNNILLQDDDVIRILPYQTRVYLKGAVKKPAIYDIKEGETASDLLRYAGGFADLAFKDILRVNRFGNSSKEIISLRQQDIPQFKLVSGDTLTVDSVANIYADRVVVTGWVYHPGTFGLKQLPTLRDIILTSKPREEAFYDRAVIRRLLPDYTPSFINFNINDVISGKFNMPLEREDSIHVYKRDELREKYSVVINGEVNKAGTYDYFTGMTVQDLVLMANGYRDGAALQKIEISRRLRTRVDEKDSSVYSLIKEISLEDTRTSGDLDFKLSPFDIVSIRRSPAYREQISVAVEGEVLYPGRYTLSASNERVSDIVKRAGGLKSNAFVEGAVLIRNTYVGITQSDAALVNTKANLINQQSGKGTAVKNADDSTLVKSLSGQQKPMSIRLADALKNPGSRDDVYLEEGDILKIPKTLQTIQTFGAINVPKQIVYRDGLTFKEAIRESGGFASNASRKHSYVVYANGEVRTTGRFLFFHFYPQIKTGAELYVPDKKSGSKLSTGEAIGLISGLTSLLGLAVVLINTSK